MTAAPLPRRTSDERDVQAPLAPRVTAQELVASLEAFAADHTRLAEVPYELRKRLLAACGKIADPSASERRAMRRALRRKDNREQRARDLEALMAASLRRARSLAKVASEHLPLHALPPPAEASAPGAGGGGARARHGATRGEGPVARARRAGHGALLLRVQGALHPRARLLRLDVRGLRGAQLPQANGALRPARAGRARHRRARED